MTVEQATDEGEHASAALLSALPVWLTLRGRHADGVRRWTEGMLGWQPVEPGAGELSPRVELTDAEGLAHRRVDQDRRSDPPIVLLVDDESVSVADVALAAAFAPLSVVAWPADRDRLAHLASAVSERAPVDAVLGERLRVGGAAGGVGTTTVCLALAGLRAWSGRRTLAVVRTAMPGPRDVVGDALADPDLWARATPVAGVAGVRTVRLVGDAPPAPTSDPRIESVVCDVGVDHDVDVLVCRPDQAALHALAGTTAAAVVVVGEGPVPLARLRESSAGRRQVRLPWSARVARAGHADRVPAGLPGTWLRRLIPLLDPPR